MISRIIDNEHHTLAYGIERRDDRFWISPLMFARKFRDEGPVAGLLTVFSLILGWGWDGDDPFSLLPRLTLKRKVYSGMLDQSVTLTWCGFAVVTHICTETIPHADLSEVDEDEAPTELSDA
jgi:hypothetical protein